MYQPAAMDVIRRSVFELRHDLEDRFQQAKQQCDNSFGHIKQWMDLCLKDKQIHNLEMDLTVSTHKEPLTTNPGEIPFRDIPQTPRANKPMWTNGSTSGAMSPRAPSKVHPPVDNKEPVKRTMYTPSTLRSVTPENSKLDAFIKEYEKYDTDTLIKECNARGINSKGSKSNLITTLAQHDVNNNKTPHISSTPKPTILKSIAERAKLFEKKGVVSHPEKPQSPRSRLQNLASSPNQSPTLGPHSPMSTIPSKIDAAHQSPHSPKMASKVDAAHQLPRIDTAQSPRIDAAHQLPRIDTAQSPRIDAAHQLPRIDTAQSPRIDAAHQLPRIDTAQSPRIDAHQLPNINTAQNPKLPSEQPGNNPPNPNINPVPSKSPVSQNPNKPQVILNIPETTTPNPMLSPKHLNSPKRVPAPPIANQEVESEPWYESPYLDKFIRLQKFIDPDFIFDKIVTCDLEEIFPSNHHVAQYTRGSSAVWDEDGNIQH